MMVHSHRQNLSEKLQGGIDYWDDQAIVMEEEGLTLFLSTMSFGQTIAIMAAIASTT
jgi:hypothetical protein